MTTSAPSILFDSATSDATFRAWGSAVSAALQACGLVQTTNTGQINWSTVTRNGTSNSEAIAGYEIYRFADSLQATKPVFIKVEYGCANMAGVSLYGNPVIYVTVSNATNGAGSLNGTVTSTRTRVSGGATLNSSGAATVGPTVSSPCFFSGDGSYINMALGASATAVPRTSGIVFYYSFPALLIIDRTRDSSGSIVGDGLVFLTSNWADPTRQDSAPASPAPTCQLLSFTGSGVGSQDLFWPLAWPGQGFQTGASGADLYFFPMPLSTPKGQNQCLAVLGTYKGDVALGSTLSVSVLGNSHTYLSLAGIAGLVSGDNARSSVNGHVPSGAVLMRYE